MPHVEANAVVLKAQRFISNFKGSFDAQDMIVLG
jgi:hypothetical protein